MSKVVNGLKYSKEHEWVKVLDGNKVRIGITDYAQHSLGDIVFAELPEVGRILATGESFGVVESVKAVSDVYSPVSGKVIVVNSELENAPEIINSDPYEAGWIIEVELSDSSELDQLLTSEEYQELIKE